MPGYTGTFCSVNIDECASGPCHYSSICVDGIDSFECVCPVNFEGVTCHEPVDWCDLSRYEENPEVLENSSRNSPCQNNGRCISLPFRFKCLCAPGWQGETCSEWKNPCYSNPCYNGDCAIPRNNFQTSQNYECLCKPGFTGELCELDINECDSNPCIFGTCRNGLDSYKCHCPLYRIGQHCDGVDIELCHDLNPCHSVGTCVIIKGDDVDVPYAVCKCPDNYTGRFCETVIDYCYSNPCRGTTSASISSEPHGMCLSHSPTIGSYQCHCHPGWTGTHCEIDINECESDPCSPGSTCVDLVGKFYCECPNDHFGVLCQVRPEACASRPCFNGGTCFQEDSVINEYFCNGSVGLVFVGK